MKKIFFLSLIFSFSSIIPLMAENKLSDSNTQIVESNHRKFSKTDLVLKKGIYYLKDSDMPFSGKVIYEVNDYINESGELKDGKKVGLWIDTYNNSGILERKNEYENGKIKDGLRKNYHWNGRLWNRANYTNGKINGLWEEFRDDGTLGMKVMMKDGEAEGLWEVFYDNGQIYYSHNYKNGIKEDGIFTFFHDNGQVKSQGEIRDGKKNGLWEYLNKDGSLEKRYIFRDDYVTSTFIPPKDAEVCILKSEEEKDVTISMNYPSAGWGFGTLNYKNKPAYFFEVGVSNGFGTQYYQLKTYKEDPFKEKQLLPYVLRNKGEKIISSGRFVNFVGNQLARATSVKDRKKGQLKALMPTLPSDYYYHLPITSKEEGYGRFNPSPQMKAILNASEGFFVDSGGCRRYFAYGWD